MIVSAPPQRIALVDAIRGSALIGLFLLHCREHFDYAAINIPHQPEWLVALNTITTDVLNFLFAGKAYAVFAMMFGFSFFLIINGAERRGMDFRGRFVWRMLVLGVIGYLTGLIFCGEILSMITIIGFPLVLLYRVPTRWLLVLAALFLLQPQFWWQLAHTFGNPEYRPVNFNVGGYYRELYAVFEKGDAASTIRANLWTGVLARHSWALSNGRYLQMFGLFIVGLLIGRIRIFEQPDLARKIAIRALIPSIAAFAALYFIREISPDWSVTKTQSGIIKRLLVSYINLAQMIVWASGFTLLYLWAPMEKILRFFIPFGRMSLSFYILHNTLGVLIFYPFGLGLHLKWAEFYSFAAGFVSLALQYPIAVWWLQRHHYGPFEWLWRSLTQLSFNTPFRRKTALNAAS